MFHSIERLRGKRSAAARVSVFYGTTLAFSWTWWGWMYVTGQVVEPGSSATHLPGLAGPLVGAVVTTGLLQGRKGLVDLLLRSLRLPHRLGLASITILAPLLLLVISLGLDFLMGFSWPESHQFFVYPGVPVTTGWLATVIVVLLLNGFGEEVGWRGYVLEQLMAEHTPFRATLWLSILWLLWHLPLFLIHQNMADMIGPALVGWALGLVLGAFVLSWLYLSFERSILVCALWHTSYNFTVATPAGGNLAPALISTAVMAAGLWAALDLNAAAQRRP